MEDYGAKNEARDTAGAFHWIIGLLKARGVPFRLTGGFAARLYGATRELADIDVEIPDDRMAELSADISHFLTFGPERYRDDEWDLPLATLVFAGQEIDLCGVYAAKIFDRFRQEWISYPADFDSVTRLTAYGLEAPVIPKSVLVDYKRKLGRKVDLADVEELSGP